MSSRWKIFCALLLLCLTLTSSQSQTISDPKWTKLNDKCIKLVYGQSEGGGWGGPSLKSACSNDGALFEPRTKYQNDYAVDYVKNVSPETSSFHIGIIGKESYDSKDRVLFKWVYVSDQQSLQFSNWASGGPLLMEEKAIYEELESVLHTDWDDDEWDDYSESESETKGKCTMVQIGSESDGQWIPTSSCDYWSYFICEKPYQVDQYFDEETQETEGDKPNCEECYDGFYLSLGSYCEPCQCSSVGSRSKICDSGNGKCFCRPNFAGHLCNLCADGYRGDKCQFQGEPGM